MTYERSDRQREASRSNGRKSKGPKDLSKLAGNLNRLTHGLCSRHVVLPGEDAARYEAMRGRFHTEWHPETLTREVLVERLCVAAWKLERATTSEMSYRRVTAEGSIHAHQAESRRRVESGLDLRHDYPAAALADLESHAPGIDRLLSVCAALESDLAKGPSAWDRPFQPARLLLLHGRDEREDAAHAGPAGRASAKLLASNQPKAAPLPPGEAEEAVAEIRADVARHAERLRERRTQVDDPAEVERRMMEAALVDATHGAQLRFRYEQTIERSIRSTIKQLMEPRRTGRRRPPAVRARAGPSGWHWWLLPPVRSRPGHWWASHQWHPDRRTQVATQCPRSGCVVVGFVRRRRVGAVPEASRSQENGPRGAEAGRQAAAKGAIILLDIHHYKCKTSPQLRPCHRKRRTRMRAAPGPGRPGPRRGPRWRPSFGRWWEKSTRPATSGGMALEAGRPGRGGAAC